jgi:hypothetical protein
MGLLYFVPMGLVSAPRWLRKVSFIPGLSSDGNPRKTCEPQHTALGEAERLSCVPDIATDLCRLMCEKKTCVAELCKGDAESSTNVACGGWCINGKLNRRIRWWMSAPLERSDSCRPGRPRCRMRRGPSRNSHAAKSPTCEANLPALWAAWLKRFGQLVNGSNRWLKSHVFCTIPEQVLLSRVPGQPPLSRWMAQIDSRFMPLVCANFSIVCASGR